MSWRLPIVFCLAVLLSGCGEKSKPAAQPAAPPPANQEPPAVLSNHRTPAPQTAPAAEVTGSDPSAMLGQLTQILRKYCVEHRTVPATFEDFAATGVARIPPAPPGKKFAIEPKRLEVVLVNR